MNVNQVTVKMIIDRWTALLTRFDTSLNSLNDEQLEKEIAPGKNRGIYLLGHLIAVHDDMLLLLDFGDKLFPELHTLFITSADKAITELPTAKELRLSWKKQTEYIRQKIESMTPDQWFERHTAVPAEDFVKEPQRNKLNILITRTSHLAYHTGQFILLT